MSSSVDWTVVRNAAVVGLVVLLPAALVASVALGDDPARWWTWLFLAVSLLAFTVAGFLAGGRRQDVPMIHGGLAAVATFAVAQLLGSGLRLARDEEVSIVAAVVGLLLALTCGVGGALGADWFHRRRRRALLRAAVDLEP